VPKDKQNKIPFIGSKTKAETDFKSSYWGLSYNFPWNPDPLCSGNDYSIYDEMIEDDQIKAAIAIKKDMVVNTGWRINGENPEVNEFVTDCFDHINETIGLDSSFDDVLRDMLSSYEYGFSLTEPVYAVENGKYVYKTLKTRAPHSFKFNVDDKGNVIEIIQSTATTEKKFSPSKFIHHVYQMQFGNPYGKSDLRAAYPAWKAKKFFLRFYSIYVEKFASGTYIGKYPRNYSQNEISAFHEIIKKVQHATSLAMPEDATLDILEKKSDSADIYIRGLDYYNMQIARSILVPDLLGIGGTETKGGSYALGKEQFKLFLGTIKKDRESLARKITMRLVRPLVLANFGDVDCWFEFIPYSHGDIEEYLKLWIEAMKVGLWIPTEEEINYFKSIIGFPETEGKPKIKPPKKPSDKIKVEEKSYKFFRELTSYEKKVDFNNILETFNREENRILPVINRITTDIYESLIDEIRDKGLLRKFKPEQINQLQPKNLKQMNSALKNYYVDLFKQSIEEAQKEIFPNLKPKKYDIDLLPEQFLDLLKIEAFKTVGDYSFNITKRAKNMLIHSIKDGVGEAEALKIIKEGLKSETERWTKTVIRTKTTEIYNEARKRYFETDDLAKQIVEAYQWSSVLDDRTSDICRYLDGKIFTIGELSARVKPPAHFNCRSVLVPITKFEDYKPNPKTDFVERKLKEKGGLLLSVGGNLKTKYQIDNKPFLQNSGAIDTFGDTIVIASPGKEKRIRVFSIFISNQSLDNNVNIEIKQSIVETAYKALLQKAGGQFQKEFSEGWLLEQNNSLIFSLSAPVNVEYTVDYIIENMKGKRIL